MSGLLLCKMGRPIRGLITLLCMVFGLFLQAQTVSIGTGTSTQRYPLTPYYGFQRSASLYTAAEINTPGGGSILSVGWEATATMNITFPVKIYLKSVPAATTTITAQNWATVTTGATLVYSANVTSLAVGWNTFQLQLPYNYNGTDNLMVLVETNYGGGGGGSGLNGAAFKYSTAASSHMYYETDTTAPTGNGTVNGNRPNVQLTFGTPPTCLAMPPGGTISTGAITATSAVLNWTAYTPVPAGGYDIYYSTTNTAPTAATVPSQSGVTGTTANLSPLTPNSTYYVWVRARCSATDQSPWTGPITFTTPPTCMPMAGGAALTVGTVTLTSAVVNWTAPTPAPAQGYEVYYSATNTAPTAATVGTPVTGTSTTLSPLTAGTTYYWWVRAVCSPTDKTPWVAGSSFTPGQIGTGTGTTSNLPVYSYYGFNYSQQLYTAAEVGAVLGTSLLITAVKFYVAAPQTPQTSYNEWVVYLGNTPKTSFTTTTDWVPAGNLTQVYSGTLPTMTAGTWITIPLATPFVWDGVSNLVVAVDENSPGYSTSAATWGSYNAGSNRGILYYNDTTNPDPTSPPTSSSRYSDIPRLMLTGVDLLPCSTAPPTNIAVSNITSSSAIVSWMPAVGATYVLQYRVVGSGAAGWQTINITTPLTGSATINNLTDGTQYEYQIATKCNGTQGAFSPIGTFTTPTLTYCNNTPVNTTSSGYISKVVVAPTNGPLMVSDSGYDVYKDYSADPTRVVTLLRNSTGNKITITKFWPGSTSSYGVVAWIDFNRNGVFEVSEKVLDTSSSTTTPVTATFIMPTAAGAVYSGTLPTRMRVVMKQSGVPTACGTFGQFDYGEVEDYAVKFINQPACSTAPPTNITVTNITDTSATFSWIGATNATYKLQYRKLGSGAAGWVVVNVVPAPGNVYTTTVPLTEQTDYEVQVATICNGSTGAYSGLVPFRTLPLQYCPMVGSGDNDHISNVTVTSSNLGVLPMSNTSVQTNYISYTTPATLITLDDNSQNNKISVSKGWTGSTGNDAVSVWIDFNRNGQFETTERILNSAASTTTPVTANFNVPSGSYTGALGTTMRVVLKRTTAPVMCQNAIDGEVEDYKVMIRPCSNAVPNPPTFTRTHNSAVITWTGVTSNVSYIVRYRVQGTTTWTEVYASTLLGNMPLTVNGLIPATTYEVEIAAICGTSIGTATPIRTFTTKCDPTPPTVSISNITPTTALVTWAPLAASSTYTMRWRKVGTTGWPNADILLPAAPANTYVLGSVIPLEPFTTYEVQIANMCNGETTLNPYSNPKVFTTERICEIPPPGLTITQLLPTSAEVKWDPFPGATYVLRYRKVGIPSWTEVPTIVNNVVLNGLVELTKYEMQVVNICNGTPGNYTPPYYFTTPTVIYCKMASASSTGEHISKVTVIPTGKLKMENASGASTYTDYTGVPKTFIEMIQGSKDNEIIIEKKWTGNTYNEGIAVWIDFNRNGEFDINERVFTSSPNTTSPVSGKFDVPVDAFVSMTDYKYVVMRVAMSRDGIPVSCANFNNGEVEDYTVRISKQGVPNPLNQTDIMIYPNPVTTILFVKNISKKAKYKIYNAAGQVIADGILLNNQVNVSRLINGVYVIDIDDNGNTAQKKFIKE
ncbi:hypothetical protein C1637_11350 [Chryseobacterium lactis]|uniref:T9SS C-terminal target domain-containing protein n=1 Tax=Chryseobacterium lactis TaxID=1241981 RepID=A0A3G6RNI6_CHRLC|nr:fibronectin type III domain-containing protein [Chryseobacterium lactis]AZA80866.1 T9SS C-terminal target domain-containing protein [Chryseobacterium lactis]AZB05868.1 T9SS C-terminal target domain-containing protein [Chryseobacterium lactis]PNW13413.1 hypothetical protein C1637_11350 [Chryseobacterium lactis]